jgi:hypothetical protein
MHWVILANVGEALSRYMRQSTSTQRGGIWGFALLAVILFWVGIYVWDERSKRVKIPEEKSESLFQQLCKTHRLNQQQRTKLLTAAKQCELAEPAVVFVDPKVLSQLAGDDSGESRAYAELGQQLFGSAFTL